SVHELTSIDRVLDWAVIWGERRKAAAEQAESVSVGFNDSSNRYSVEQIEEIVRTGAPEGANRSDTFHMVIGHYLGCGWDSERILAHLEQHPHGIGERYLRQGRLAGEVARSTKKYGRTTLPLFDNGGWTGDWQAKTPQPAPMPLPGDPEQLDHADEDL